MSIKVSELRHPKEKVYGAIMTVVGIFGWVFVAFILLVSIATRQLEQALALILYGGAFWLFSLIVRAFTRAYMFGHYVMVGPDQFPHLHKMVVEGSAALGLDEAPATFVYNSHGVMNAMALRLVGRHRYVWLTSALIDADNDEQVRFVVGHELGHHAAGHLDRLNHFLKLPAHFVPLLAQAYSRGRELTCDRVGAMLAGNLVASCSALQMLASGSAKLNQSMNLRGFLAQEQMVPPVAGWLLHIFSHYPRLTRRAGALVEWARETSQQSPEAASIGGLSPQPQVA